MCRPHRGQARSHSRSSPDTDVVYDKKTLWERACSRWRCIRLGPILGGLHTFRRFHTAAAPEGCLPVLSNPHNLPGGPETPGTRGAVMRGQARVAVPVGAPSTS